MWRLNGSVGRLSGGVWGVGWDVGRSLDMYTGKERTGTTQCAICMYQSTCTYIHYRQI